MTVARTLKKLEGSNLSERAFAEEQGIAKSTLQGWRYSRSKITAIPEIVDFFESEVGHDFLHRLVYSMVFHFHECGSASIRSLSAFFEDAGLNSFTASKPSYLKGLACKMQEEISLFGEEQTSLLTQNMTPRSITVAQDETFFRNKPCLVGMEPISNYIFLEKMAKDRKAKTWNTLMSEALKGIPVKVIQSTSDEGSSLLKHTKESLGAAHSPDTFHIIQEISRSGSAALKMKENHCRQELASAIEEKVKKAEKVSLLPENTFKRETQQESLFKKEKAEIQALQHLHEAKQRSQEFTAGRKAVSRNYHPYDLQNGMRQSPQKVEKLLTKNMLRCKKEIVNLGVKSHDKLAKAMRLIPAMKATLIFYFSMSATFLDDLNFDFRTRALIEDELMPAAYLKMVAAKEKNKKEAARLMALAKEKLIDFTRHIGPYSCYSSKEHNKMWEAAYQAVQIFQRSSSCVEGRNAQLTMKYHNLHRLTESKLKSLTVIHNFHIKRSDGTTPARRFFGQDHGNLFEAILKRMPALSRPRKHQAKVA
ncbi:MAG: hypothetical protein HRT70_10405 [Flavobacteriaceae bacterium]|nr:hypothetical protein [Flavobacteriaceae bacterium]